MVPAWLVVLHDREQPHESGDGLTLAKQSHWLQYWDKFQEGPRPDLSEASTEMTWNALRLSG